MNASYHVLLQMQPISIQKWKNHPHQAPNTFAFPISFNRVRLKGQSENDANCPLFSFLKKFILKINRVKLTMLCVHMLCVCVCSSIHFKTFLDLWNYHCNQDTEGSSVIKSLLCNLPSNWPLATTDLPSTTIVLSFRKCHI